MDINALSRSEHFRQAVLEALTRINRSDGIIQTTEADGAVTYKPAHPPRISVRKQILSVLRHQPHTAAGLIDLLGQGRAGDDHRKVYASVYQALSVLHRAGQVQATVDPSTGRHLYALVS